MNPSLNELHLEAGSQVVTILTNKDHPKGYARKWVSSGKTTPIHMLVAIDPDRVGFLRVSDSQYREFMHAARDIDPEEWSFKVTCTDLKVGGAHLPRVVNIKPTFALAPMLREVSDRAASLFKCVHDPNILGA